MSGGGGGSKSTTTTTKAQPWSGVEDYLTTGYNSLANLYGDVQRNAKGKLTSFNFDPSQGPQYYPGQTIASPNALEAMGQGYQQAWGLGNALPMAQSAGSSLNSLFGSAGDTSFGLGGVQNAMGTLGNFGNAATASGADQSNQAFTGLGNVAGTLQGGGDWMQRIGAGNFQQGMGNMAAGAGDLSGRGQYIQDVGFNQGAIPAINQLMAAGDPSSNPYFQSAVQSAIRPVTQQFQEQVMPGIKSGAIGAGQMGSSRQGVAEGIASRGYMDTVGDITSGMGNQAYAQGLQAMQAAGGLGSGLASLGGQQIGQGAGLYGQQAGLGSQFAGQGLGALGQAGGLIGQQGSLGQGMMGQGTGALGAAGSLGQGIYGTGMESTARGAALAPGVAQMGYGVGQNLEGIGQQLTADQQGQIDADMARWNYQQNLPFTMMSDYLNMLEGAPGGQTSSAMQSPQTGSLLGRTGGGALAGYGMTGSPWGALAGGLLGLF